MKKFNSSVRYGGYSLMMTAVALAIIIIVNLALNALPATFTSITDEKTDIYKISDVSVGYMKKLDQKITVYIVAIEGANSEHDLMIRKYVERFSILSENVTVKYVDPEIKPGFLSSYNGDGNYTEQELSSGYTHLVVESDRRAKIVAYGEIITTALSGDDLTAFYQAYGYVPYSYNIENCLLSAIDYVSLEVLPTIYYTSGHKENALDDGFKAYANYENIGLKELDIDKEGKIPDDAQAVIIYAPETDFTEKEIKALKAYADKGGDIILAGEYNKNLTDRNHDHLYGFTSEYYGMSYNDVIVLEGDSNRVYYYPDCIFATSTDKVPSIIAQGQSGYVLFTYAHAIQVNETLPEGVTVDTLFTTTSKGYAKTEYGKDFTYDKKEGDLEETFVLGALSSRKAGEGKSRLWWFSSTDAISTDMNPYVAIHVLTESVEKEESVSAAAVVLTYERLDISDDAAKAWSIVFIALIPAAILGYGIFVRVRRVRR